MYRSILVPLDGSSFGEQALPYALGITRRAQAQLQLAHVYTAPLIPGYDATADADLRAREQEYLEGLVARLRAHWDGPISSMLLDGPVAAALHDHAVEIEADLVVMTTHGRGTLSRFWLGSVADKLVRQMPMPVLLVRPQEHMPDLAHAPVFKHILIPLDGSPLAEQMLNHVSTLGQLMHADCTLLQAIDPMIIANGTELYAAVLDERVLEQLRTSAQAYLDHIAARLPAEVPRVQTAVVIGQPAGAILDYANAHAVDLIALETHGRSGVARWLVGGVADKVARGATVPVLLHRPQSEERTP